MRRRFFLKRAIRRNQQAIQTTRNAREALMDNCRHKNTYNKVVAPSEMRDIALDGAVLIYCQYCNQLLREES